MGRCRVPQAVRAEVSNPLNCREPVMYDLSGRSRIQPPAAGAQQQSWAAVRRHEPWATRC